MNIRQLLILSTNKLQKFSSSPSLDAEVLLAFVINKPKEYLYTNPNKVLLRNYVRTYQKLISKRTTGLPVAYLIGHKEFYGLDFKVNNNVLIPRPETEGLVELILAKIRDQRSLSILDVGTGSGNIIVSLAKYLFSYSRELDHEYFASDISKKALRVARTNARNHKVKIGFKHGGLLSPWKNKSFDILVANLPYGWKEWKNNSSIDSKSIKFEPKKALFTENLGLAIYKKLFKQISSGQNTPNHIYIELDPRQSKMVISLVKKYLPEHQVTIKKDLYNKNRYAIITKTRHDKSGRVG